MPHGPANHPPALSAAPASRHSARLRAPFATLGIDTAHGCVTGIAYLPIDTPERDAQDPVAARAVRELIRYLADPEFRFTVSLAPQGTPFRRRVWDAIAAIPVGASRTYGEIARTVASAPRAVGGACGANPIALVIPCHRVVGSRGALGGFMNAAAGDPVAIKRWLLVHEGYRFGA
ncbi:MAG: methylated-DNA--[protein]-cysteine S-methyltransferase [Casimicrobiaceae bacterium]